MVRLSGGRESDGRRNWTMAMPLQSDVALYLCVLDVVRSRSEPIMFWMLHFVESLRSPTAVKILSILYLSILYFSISLSAIYQSNRFDHLHYSVPLGKFSTNHLRLHRQSNWVFVLHFFFSP